MKEPLDYDRSTVADFVNAGPGNAEVIEAEVIDAEVIERAKSESQSEEDSSLREDGAPSGRVFDGQDRQAGASQTEHNPLFPDDALQTFRTHWAKVQTSFVDEPRTAVKKADDLVANLVELISGQFAEERERLEKQWHRDEDIDTEALRQALKRYRAFFDRLLAF
jgi:hypothetical protein